MALEPVEPTADEIAEAEFGVEPDPEMVGVFFTEADRNRLIEVHAVLSELKGLEAKLAPLLEGAAKNPMLKMFLKG